MTRRVFIIAEAGVNHNGSLELARQLIDAAAEAGADTIKFQTFRAEEEISRHAAKADYQKRSGSAAESQLDMVRRLELDTDAHLALIGHCRTRGIQFLSSPFDISSIDLLTDTLDLSMLKIPSGEITHAPYLLHMARKGRPVILSTGMASLDEVEQALKILAFGYMRSDQKPSRDAISTAYAAPAARAALLRNVQILHCTTAYPTDWGDVNLAAMDTLREAFHLPVGYSDHTTGIAIAIAAAARGAVTIEKHLTLDRTLDGPDHAASLEPAELADMVRAIRAVEDAIGDGQKFARSAELSNMPAARKSLVARTKIRQGEVFSEANLTCKRPGTGLSPMLYWDVIGSTARLPYDADEIIADDEHLA